MKNRFQRKKKINQILYAVYTQFKYIYKNESNFDYIKFVETKR